MRIDANFSIAVEDSPAAETALVRQIELGQIQVNQG